MHDSLISSKPGDIFLSTVAAFSHQKHITHDIPASYTYSTREYQFFPQRKPVRLLSPTLGRRVIPIHCLRSRRTLIIHGFPVYSHIPPIHNCFISKVGYPSPFHYEAARVPSPTPGHPEPRYLLALIPIQTDTPKPLVSPSA